MPLVGGFGCLEQCLYGMALESWRSNSMISTNQSTVSGWTWTNERSPLCLVVVELQRDVRLTGSPPYKVLQPLTSLQGLDVST